MKILNIKVSHKDLIPTTGTEGSAGYDLYIANDVRIRPGAMVKVGTGVSLELDPGYKASIIPRSSTGSLNIELANTQGLIDSDYRGELFLQIRNIGRETFPGYREDSFFQMVIEEYVKPVFNIVDELGDTDRGDKGFGSTKDLEL